MVRIREYLRSQYRLLFLFLYGGISFGSIFFLARLPMDYYFLGMEIFFFGLSVYLLAGYFFYKKKQSLRQELENVKKEHLRLECERRKEREELEAYFLLWLHQIKTPITVSSLLLRKLCGEEAEELRRQLFYIEEYSLMAMNYLKLEGREADMDIAPIELDGLLRPLIKKYARLFIHKHITLSYEAISAKVISDARWLSVLLEQVIANAVKYTDKGKIEIFYEEQEAVLRIRDTGIGIRSEDIKKIFDRGYSGFNGRGNEKSSGLGLYMVKRLAELLHIRVEVTSVLYKGSEFSIFFPIQEWDPLKGETEGGVR